MGKVLLPAVYLATDAQFALSHEAGGRCMEFVLSWIEQHPGLAAWAQAIFSVVAILFAALLPIIHARYNDRQQVLKSKTLLSFLAHRQFELFTMLYVPLQKSVEDWGEQLNKYEEDGLGSEWSAHRLMLDAISPLGFNAKELNDVVHLKTAAAYANEVYEGLGDWDLMDDSHRQTIRIIKKYKDKAHKIYEDTGIKSDQEI